MFSKVIKWLKNPARYMWIKSPVKLTIAIGILAIIGTGTYLAYHGLKADVLNTSPPKIITFSAPYKSSSKDYLIKIQVDNVTNLIQDVGNSRLKSKAACIIYSGTSAYALTATANGGTRIPLTFIHRKNFETEWGQKDGGMGLKKEAIKINCLNNYGASVSTATVESSNNTTPINGVMLTAPAITNPNLAIPYSWEDPSEKEVCGTTVDEAMDDEWAVSSKTALISVVDTPKYVRIFCRNKDENFINFATGQVIFLNPVRKQWKLIFTAPKEVKPNTDFKVQYSVYDEKGKIQKVGTYCMKTDSWKGQTADGSGTATIAGWASGAKTFTLICLTPDGGIIAPVSQTITVVNRTLQFTVDGQNVADNSNYQPPVNSSVLLAWQYQGPTTDTCTSKAINATTGQIVGTFNGPIAFTGQKSAGQSSQIISYSVTCSTEKKTIRVLAQLSTLPITPPVTPSTLSLTINPSDYSSVSSLGVYQLKSNQSTISWILTPTAVGTPCIGSGDITAWNIKRSSSGSQLLTNISGTKKITLQCGMVSKSLSVNYTPTITDPFTFKVMGRSYKDFPNEYVTKGTTATIEWNYTGTASSCTLWTKNINNPGTAQNPLGTASTAAKSGNISYIFNYDTETRTLQCGTSQGTVIITGTSPGTVRLN